LRAKWSQVSAPVLCLDSDWSDIARQPEENPPARVTPENLAYVIYTSGSTGQPKGVLIEHRGLANVVRAQVETFGVGPGDRLLQFLAPHVDAAQAEIFRAWAAGATLCPAPAEVRLPGPALVDFLRTQAITLAAFPPSLLAALPEDTDLPALRTLVLGG